MELEHTKYLMPDRSGRGNHLAIEVNWNSKVKPCLMVKFSDKSGNEYIVSRDELMSIMFMLSDEEQQMGLVKPVVQEATFHDRVYSVLATRPYQKGEKILVKLSIPVQMSVMKERHKQAMRGTLRRVK